MAKRLLQNQQQQQRSINPNDGNVLQHARQKINQLLPNCSLLSNLFANKRKPWKSDTINTSQSNSMGTIFGLLQNSSSLSTNNCNGNMKGSLNHVTWVPTLQTLPSGSIGTSNRKDTIFPGILIGKRKNNNGNINDSNNPIVNQLTGLSSDTIMINNTNKNMNNNKNNDGQNGTNSCFGSDLSKTVSQESRAVSTIIQLLQGCICDSSQHDEIQQFFNNLSNSNNNNYAKKTNSNTNINNMDDISMNSDTSINFDLSVHSLLNNSSNNGNSSNNCNVLNISNDQHGDFNNDSQLQIR